MSIEAWGDDEDLERRLRRHPGPYLAVSAVSTRSDGASDQGWPWIVVGSTGDNIFGRLWSKSQCEQMAAELNEKAA